MAKVVAAGADWILFDVRDNHYVPNLTFGPMVCEALRPLAGKAMLREQGCLTGLAFNPATPLHRLDSVMDKLDLVMLMSVNPGFGGQGFIASTLPKLR